MTPPAAAWSCASPEPTGYQQKSAVALAKAEGAKYYSLGRLGRQPQGSCFKEGKPSRGGKGATFDLRSFLRACLVIWV
jgi:hypothetical protein